MPEMKNPSVVKQQMVSPIGDIPKRKGKGAARGNASWLKTRRRLRPSVFRGMR